MAANLSHIDSIRIGNRWIEIDELDISDDMLLRITGRDWERLGTGSDIIGNNKGPREVKEQPR